MFDKDNNHKHHHHLDVEQPKFQWAAFGTCEPLICHSLPQRKIDVLSHSYSDHCKASHSCKHAFFKTGNSSFLVINNSPLTSLCITANDVS